MDKRLRQLARLLEPQGVTFTRSGSGHYVVRGPDGRRITTFSATGSDPRGWDNSLAYLKRAGFRVRG